MWQKQPKKTIFTVRVDNYAPEICELTYPLIKAWAHKIGAQFHVIRERKFPDWPPVYEKLQIYQIAQDMQNDWNIYLDSDALVHPDTFDITEHLSRDTVCHNGNDMAGCRWRYDRFFQRDGRHIGSCNWLAIASDLCIELWKPLDDFNLCRSPRQYLSYRERTKLQGGHRRPLDRRLHTFAEHRQIWFEV